jgi:hypothetical protein
MPIPNGVDLAKCSVCCEGVLVRSVGHFRHSSWCGRDGQWQQKNVPRQKIKEDALCHIDC